MVKIIVDCFGADNGLECVVQGAVDALAKKDGYKVVLVGDKDRIEKCITGYEDRIEIIHTTEEITCEEEPVKAIRSKKESSIVKGLELLKSDEECKAFISAGSTGAVLVGSTLKIGRLEGVSRPALCPVLHTSLDDKKVLLLDCGANADCKPINLCHFALMATCYSQAVLGVEKPVVALLSNGTEAQKGNALVHEVYPALSQMQEINFAGNTEARDILSGDFDIVVTDGFSGNVALKSIEGGIKLLMKELKKEVHSSLRSKIGGLLLKKSLKKIKGKLDFASYSGALFLGLKNMVYKVHGSTNSMGVTKTVLQAVEAVENNVIDLIAEKIEKTDLSAVKVE